MIPGLSEEIQYHVILNDHSIISMFTNHQVRQLATSERGSQPGDSGWPPAFLKSLCEYVIRINMITLSTIKFEFDFGVV